MTRFGDEHAASVWLQKQLQKYTIQYAATTHHGQGEEEAHTTGRSHSTNKHVIKLGKEKRKQ